MKRPLAHRTGDQAEAEVTKKFLTAGWIVNKLHSDYGFDLLVQRTMKESVTPRFALIQVKGTLRSLESKHNRIKSFRVRLKDVRYWSQVALPAFLAIVDTKQGNVFLVSCPCIVSNLPVGFLESTDRGKTRYININIKPEALLTSRLFGFVEKEVDGFWKAVHVKSRKASKDSLFNNLVAISMSSMLALGDPILSVVRAAVLPFAVEAIRHRLLGSPLEPAAVIIPRRLISF